MAQKRGRRCQQNNSGILNSGQSFKSLRGRFQSSRLLELAKRCTRRYGTLDKTLSINIIIVIFCLFVLLSCSKREIITRDENRLRKLKKEYRFGNAVAAGPAFRTLIIVSCPSDYSLWGPSLRFTTLYRMSNKLNNKNSSHFVEFCHKKLLISINFEFNKINEITNKCFTINPNRI